MELTPAVRRRGLNVLLIDAFLMYGGFFMLVPLISVQYVERLDFAAAAVGIVLAVRQLTQQGLTLFGGALADRIGPKGLICWGMAIRVAGFGGLAWAHTWIALLLLCVLAAIGGALFDAPSRSAAALLTTPETRGRFFSLNGVVGGLGMTIGPLIGSLLLNVDFGLVCFVAAACFALACLVTVVGLPRLAVPKGAGSVGAGLWLAARDRTFVWFTLLLCGYWFMWVQLSISLPLVAQQWGVPTLATPVGALALNGAALIYALNAGMTVVLQYPLLRLAERWLQPLPITVLGIAVMALGLGLIGGVASLAGLLACVALFSLGALLVQPTQQSVVADMADPQAYGAYFGFASLSLAFGGGAGNYMGGWLYDRAREWTMPALPWLVFCAVGLLVAVGLALLNRTQRRAAPSKTAVAQSTRAA